MPYALKIKILFSGHWDTRSISPSVRLLVMGLVLLVPPLPILLLLFRTKPGKIHIRIAMRLTAPPPIILGLVIAPFVIVVVIGVVVARCPMDAPHPCHRTNQSRTQKSQPKNSRIFFHVVVPENQ